jgi:hypothetical protein
MNWKKHKYSYIKSRRSSTPLSFLLKDLDLNDYIIIKITSNFRIIEEKDIEKYAGFFLIKKSDFDEENFKLWLDFIKYNKIDFKYLSRPFPNFYLTKKLKEL